MRRRVERQRCLGNDQAGGPLGKSRLLGRAGQYTRLGARRQTLAHEGGSFGSALDATYECGLCSSMRCAVSPIPGASSTMSSADVTPAFASIALVSAGSSERSAHLPSRCLVLSSFGFRVT